MYKKKIKKNISGFTLLELVIAMFILSIVTAGTFGLFVTSHKFLMDAKNRLEAVNQAGQVMERLRVYVSSHPSIPLRAGEALTITAAGHSRSPTVIGLVDKPTIEGTDSQDWNYTVTGVDGTDCRRVVVEVNWEEA